MTPNEIKRWLRETESMSPYKETLNLIKKLEDQCEEAARLIRLVDKTRGGTQIDEDYNDRMKWLARYEGKTYGPPIFYRPSELEKMLSPFPLSPFPPEVDWDSGPPQSDAVICPECKKLILKDRPSGKWCDKCGYTEHDGATQYKKEELQ